MNKIIYTQQASYHVMTLYGEIGSFEDYEDIFCCLDALSDQDIVDIRVNCPGGAIDIGASIISAINRCSATVNIIVEAPCYSMGAIIALSGDSIVLQPHTFLMFHDSSTGVSSKSNEIHKLITAQMKVFKSMSEMICCPFLTKQEIAAILYGKDLYIHWDDPTLKKRIDRHYKPIDKK